MTAISYLRRLSNARLGTGEDGDKPGEPPPTTVTLRMTRRRRRQESCDIEDCGSTTATCFAVAYRLLGGAVEAEGCCRPGATDDTKAILYRDDG